jgi:hypothetical protein
MFCKRKMISGQLSREGWYANNNLKMVDDVKAREKEKRWEKTYRTTSLDGLVLVSEVGVSLLDLLAFGACLPHEAERERERGGEAYRGRQ